MRILIVGGGGREHALAWSLRREQPDADIYCAPGNPGTAAIATNLAMAADDIDRIADAADMYGIDLTIVGPEAPLAMGLADRLRAEGRAAFGPGAAAARLEASKAFAKEVMEAAGVPTAASRTFTDLAQAREYVSSHAEPLVVKASGLAGGKGAIVCEDRAAALAALDEMLGAGAFGDAGREVVVESFLPGEELSVFAATDGERVVLFPASQDHKRLEEGDQGPNTGGMGAYSPVSLATPALLERITCEVLEPTLAEMRRRGTPYRGLLYAGLMIDETGAPSVVEFNCRFGDPETQVVLPLVRGGLTDCLENVALGGRPEALDIDHGSYAVTTVLAARGYPAQPEKGAAINIPGSLPDGVTVFHAGTMMDEAGVLRVSGGRVLNVTAVADSLAEAQRLSREAAERIEFEGKVFRGDIGWREIRREK